MSFENPSQINIEIESRYSEFVPDDFRVDPLGYFESQGRSIKAGEKLFDEEGRLREDPTAVKELPMWSDSAGRELHVVGKRVNTLKGKVGESGDPFYEYGIIEQVRSIGLPAAEPIARVEQDGTHLFVMEKISGMRWSDDSLQKLRDQGYSVDDISALKEEAILKIKDLQEKFESAGIMRGWKVADMIFDVDVLAKKINAVTPVDWERTKIDQEKFRDYKEKYSLEN